MSRWFQPCSGVIGIGKQSLQALEMKHRQTLISFLLVLLVALGTTVPWLGLSDFYSRGEPREALVAQDMLRTGDVVLPEGYSNGIPSKPPFDHWLIALFSLPQGEVTEFTSRLPSAVASILFSAAFFWVLRARTGEKQALLSSLILLTTFEWGRGASSCRVDMVHAASLAGALLAGFLWIEHGRQRFSLLVLILLVAAFLSKGPVGIVLPAFVLTAAMIIRRLPFTASVTSQLKLFIPALGLGSLWYLLAYLQGGSLFIDKVFYENVARFTSTMSDSPHEHGVLYLFLTSFAGLLPWSLLAIPPIVERLKARSLREGIRKWSSIEQFALVASLCIFLFYTIPSSKRSVYVLAAYPFVSILLARALLRAPVASRELSVRLHSGICAVVAALSLCLIVLVSGGFIFSPLLPREYAHDLKEILSGLFAAGPLVVLLILAPAVVGAYSYIQRGKLSPGKRMAAFYVTLFLVVNGSLLPAVSRYMSEKRLARMLEEKGVEEARLFSFGREFYGLSFYLKRPISRLESAETLSEGDVVVLRQKRLESLREKLPPSLSLSPLAERGLSIAPKAAVAVVRVERAST